MAISMFSSECCYECCSVLHTLKTLKSPTSVSHMSTDTACSRRELHDAKVADVSGLRFNKGAKFTHGNLLFVDFFLLFVSHSL